MDTRAIRRALDLRLVDVQRATGVAAEKLSLAERGLARLTDLERRAVESFLRARLTSEIAADREGGA
jgi:hypothetical protein